MASILNMKFEITVIIVSYNTCEMTLKCLSSLISETNCTYEVIVVDNMSSDGSADKIQELYGDQITLIRSEENLGFAGGNNLAADFAKGEYILLLNPDTVVLDHAVDKLLSFSRNTPNAGIWGGMTLFADGRLNPSSCWMAQSLWSLASQLLGLNSLFRNNAILNPEGLGGWDRLGERRVDIVSGCFLLIQNATWQQLEGFDLSFFMYGEEADLCLRGSKKLGLQPMVSSSARIVHHGGASETSRSQKQVKLLDAKMRLIRKHFPPTTRIVGLTLLAFWPATRYLAHRLLALVGDQAASEKAIVWKEVLAERASWLKFR